MATAQPFGEAQKAQQGTHQGEGIQENTLRIIPWSHQGIQEKGSQTQNYRSVVRSFIPESLHLEGPVLVYLGLKAGCLHNAPGPGVFKGLCELVWVWLCLQYSVSNSTTLCSFMEADFNLKPSDLLWFSVALIWTQ